MSLKIGIIGFSKGNGHPYSWAAIFNGYSSKEMSKCPFPAIPKYLAREKWPDSKIENAKVTGIWTQSEEISKSIASASLIKNLFKTKEDLIDNSDLIILGRDDAENHYENSYYALKKKKPIFIDKPIALSIKDLDKLYEISDNSRQIFSCSSMSFCPEFSLLANTLKNKDLRSIELTSPKTWARYSVHLIDPLIKYLRKLYSTDFKLDIIDVKTIRKETSVFCILKTFIQKEPVKIKIITTGESNGNLGFYAFNKNRKLIMKGIHNKPFYAFKSSLEKFLKINHGDFEGYNFNYQHHSEVVKIIQAKRFI